MGAAIRARRPFASPPSAPPRQGARGTSGPWPTPADRSIADRSFVSSTDRRAPCGGSGGHSLRDTMAATLTVRRDPPNRGVRASVSELPCRARRRTLVWIGGVLVARPERKPLPATAARSPAASRFASAGDSVGNPPLARVGCARASRPTDTVARATLRLRGQPPGGRGYDPTGVLRRGLRGPGPRLGRRSARMPPRSASSSASRTPLPCCRSTGSGSAPGA